MTTRETPATPAGPDTPHRAAPDGPQGSAAFAAGESPAAAASAAGASRSGFASADATGRIPYGEAAGPVPGAVPTAPQAADGGDDADLARPPVTLVVLDMAGTTVADGGLVEEAFSRAVRRLGVEPGSEVYERQLDYVRATMGESKITVFRALFGAEDRARAANSAFEEAYAELVDSGLCAPLPGAEEAVRELRADGRKVVLTTGFARTTQDAILAALGWQDLADLTLCPADAGRGRPHPDMVLTALLRTGTGAVRQVATAGDTASDVRSGLRAGAAVAAGVTTGAHTAEQLHAAGATHVLGSVAELPALLRER